MGKKLMIEVPDSVELDARELTLMLAAHLYEHAVLSLGQAADLAGLGKRAFAEVLGKYHVSLINYPASEIARDARNA